jgi:alkylation response protein AidB-like acyl-CoA dehydrogenase
MLEFASEDAAAIADAVQRFSARAIGEPLHEAAQAQLTPALWRELGELGVLGLKPGIGSTENSLTAAAVYALGHAAFPGPLSTIYLARALLDGEQVEEIETGDLVVALGDRARMPWANIAGAFIALDGDGAFLVEAQIGAAAETLGGEHWAHITSEEKDYLGAWTRFAVQVELPLAAYLTGACNRLLDETAAYAAERKQFGRAIGEFQGVSLPLADVATRVEAACNLLKIAAHRLDLGAEDAPSLMIAAGHLARAAAIELSYVAHQTFGAFGIVKSGPVFSLTRRLMQWAHQAPRPPITEDILSLASNASLLLMQRPEADAASALLMSEEDSQFLADVRAFLAPFCPIQNYLVTQNHAESDRFYKALAARNWLAMAWPTAHSGLGGSRLREFLLWNEIAFEGIARPPQGVGIIAKTIMAHGTDAQKAHWLERIRRHDATFALAYSEPNAGSDLAGLTCRATRDSDHYVISGNKCWNSKAHLVSHLWLLARTGEPGSRGRGLSLFIVDAKTPGVTIKPLEQMDGNVFTEIHFSDARIPADCLVGEENGAWQMIGQALAEERHIHFGPGRVRSDFRRVCEWAKKTGLDQRQDVQEKLKQLALAVLEAEANSLPMLLSEGSAAEAATNKVTHTRVLQAIARAALEFGGTDVLFAEEGIEVLWRQSITETIGGGATQIMQSIIARQRMNLSAKS